MTPNGLGASIQMYHEPIHHFQNGRPIDDPFVCWGVGACPPFTKFCMRRRKHLDQIYLQIFDEVQLFSFSKLFLKHLFFLFKHCDQVISRISGESVYTFVSMRSSDHIDISNYRKKRPTPSSLTYSTTRHRQKRFLQLQDESKRAEVQKLPQILLFLPLELIFQSLV